MATKNSLETSKQGKEQNLKKKQNFEKWNLQKYNKYSGAE